MGSQRLPNRQGGLHLQPLPLGRLSPRAHGSHSEPQAPAKRLTHPFFIPEREDMGLSVGSVEAAWHRDAGTGDGDMGRGHGDAGRSSGTQH